MPSAEFWIAHLGLVPHPEGGHYRESYRSPESIPHAALPARFAGGRAYSTAIYFLLAFPEASIFHRLTSDEMWHFYDGDPLRIYLLDGQGVLQVVTLGRDCGKGQTLQCVVRAGVWVAAELQQAGQYSLVGCTVAPGFDFADIEFADGKELSRVAPQHTALINRLTTDKGRIDEPPIHD